MLPSTHEPTRRFFQNHRIRHRRRPVTPPPLTVVGEDPIPDTNPAAPFFLILADYDRGVFCVEGPMTDDQPWKEAAMRARNHERRIECGPFGPDRDALASEYHQTHKLAGVPPGSIVRLRQ